MKLSSILASLVLTIGVPALCMGMAVGGDYMPLENFPPGVYEAKTTVKVYYDLENKAVEKGVTIKKGSKVNVYSAGHKMNQKPSIEWFNLSEASECNGNLLPWDKFAWAGVKSKDFKRVGDLEAPKLDKGIVTNCGRQVGGSTVASGKGQLTLPANPNPMKSDGKMKSVSMNGTIEFGHNEAGGYFGLNTGKKKLTTLVYVFAADDKAQDKLQQLAGSKTKVNVSGTLETWKDGSSSFSDASPINIAW